MQDLVYELAGGDPLKINDVLMMKVSDAMIWIIAKEKKAFTEWLMQRNGKE